MSLVIKKRIFRSFIIDFMHAPSPALQKTRVASLPSLGAAGFTLVELLVVIAIIGTLMGLLLPAVQSAREAGRRASCGNNIKQIALASLLHENTQQQFPSGGWGWAWVADPDRGSGERQPGGWAFAVLPYLELQTLHDIGVGATFEQKKLSRVTLTSQPVGMFKCPTRPRSALGTYLGTNIGGNDKINMTETSTPTVAMRGDYAMNAGSQSRNQVYRGPATLEEGDSGSYAWPDVSDHTGICYQRSAVRSAQITDGMSKTLLLGEKYVNPTEYTSGIDFSENSNLYTGYENDNHRVTAFPPQQDTPGLTIGEIFGSSHPGIFGMAMCDGSIRFTSFFVEPALWSALGGRSDGQYTSSDF
jgi:prepilin-type N-terminal cleavage/methylation domain-containing protein